MDFGGDRIGFRGGEIAVGADTSAVDQCVYLDAVGGQLFGQRGAGARPCEIPVVHHDIDSGSS